MADRTGIEWCDSTFNPWIGCTRVSPACDHCYAAVSTPARAMNIAWGAGQPRRRTSPENWKLPLRWNAKRFYSCNGCGWRGDEPYYPEPEAMGQCPTCRSLGLTVARRRVFCASLADVFDNEVDPQWRADLLELIDATPNLDWLLLTKRIGNVVRLLTDLRDSEPSDVRWGRLNAWLQHGRPPENVWLGATICNQAEADRDIPKLLQCPAAVRWISAEPLLGSLDLGWYLRANVWEDGKPVRGSDYGHGTRLDWVVAGGESGPGARPMHPAWARSLRDQCSAAGVPFLFKRWGEWCEGMARPDWEGVANDGSLRVNDEALSVVPMSRVGKKAAGRELDGVLHDGYPDARTRALEG